MQSDHGNDKRDEQAEGDTEKKRGPGALIENGKAFFKEYGEVATGVVAVGGTIGVIATVSFWLWKHWPWCYWAALVFTPIAAVLICRYKKLSTDWQISLGVLASATSVTIGLLFPPHLVQTAEAALTLQTNAAKPLIQITQPFQSTTNVMVYLGGVSPLAIRPDRRETNSPFVFYLAGTNLLIDCTVALPDFIFDCEIRSNRVVRYGGPFQANYDENAVEIVKMVDKKVIFQFTRQAPKVFALYGMFRHGSQTTVWDKNGRRSVHHTNTVELPSLSNGLMIERLFKYPAWQYLGQRE